MSDPDMGGCGDLTVLTPASSFPWYSAPCWNYEYDAGGNLIRQQDAKGQVIWFQYDALSRLRQKDYGTQKTIGSGDVVYTYDSGSNGIGCLSQVSDLSGSSAYSYDVMGHIIQTDKIVGGTTYTTKTQYDSAGRVYAIAYPDNPDVYSVNDEYNGPVLKRVYEGAINHVQYSGHNGLGQPGTAVYANGVTTTYTYSNSGNSTCPQDNYRLCTQRTVHGGSPAYQDLRYSYDDVGNVGQITDILDATNTQTFTYDELNRLSSAQATVYSTIDYDYDEIGNMRYNSQMGGIYTYPLNGIRPHAVQTAGGNTYSYDDNGNMTSGAGRAIIYDYDNRLVSITAGGVTTTFLYDGGGSRVRKTSNGVSTIYIGKLYENTPDGCIKYIFAGDQRIAMRDAAGSLFYYHTDHLGSSSVPSPTTISEYYDQKVIENKVFIASAAGNCDPQCSVISPAIAYSVMAVGGYDDHNTSNLADDTMYRFSSYIDTISGVAKPEIVAPAVAVKTTDEYDSLDDALTPGRGPFRHQFGGPARGRRGGLCGGQSSRPCGDCMFRDSYIRQL